MDSEEAARVSDARQAVAQGFTWLTSTGETGGPFLKRPGTTDRSCIRLLARSLCSNGQVAPMTSKEVLAARSRLSQYTAMQIGTLKDEQFISTIQARVAGLSQSFVDVGSAVRNVVISWRTPSVGSQTATSADAWKWKLATDLASLHVWDVSSRKYIGPLLPHLHSAVTDSLPVLPVRARVKSTQTATPDDPEELTDAAVTAQDRDKTPLYVPEESERDQMMKTTFSVSYSPGPATAAGQPVGVLEVTNGAVRPLHLIGVRVYDKGQEDKALWVTVDLVVRPTPSEHVTAQTVQMLCTFPLYDKPPSTAPVLLTTTGGRVLRETQGGEGGNVRTGASGPMAVTGKKRGREEETAQTPNKWLMGMLGRTMKEVDAAPATKLAQIIFRFL